MNRVEVLAILKVLRLAYPQFYKNLTVEDAEETVNIWSMMFADDNAQIVTEAVKSMICTLRYPPVIADIKEKIHLITADVQMTEMEAWNLVQKAISNSYYASQDEFDKLPEMIRSVISNPSQLREWGMMETDTVNSVIQSNFMRSYTAKKKQSEIYRMLPESTKEMIEGIACKFKISGAKYYEKLEG